jgi:hypothetical protein
MKPQLRPYWVYLTAFCKELKVSACRVSAQPPAKKNGRSNRKRNSEKANIEYRIMNVEVMYSVYFKKD